jgi:hypothetical protein
MTRTVLATVLSKHETCGWFWNTFTVRFRLLSGLVVEGDVTAEQYYAVVEGTPVTFTATREADGDWSIPGLRRA